MKTFLTALIMGVSGAVAVGISIALGWPTWVMFIAWVAYYVFGKSPGAAAFTLVQMVLGILLGILIQLLGKVITNHLAAAGLPLAVFIMMGVLVYISKETPFRNLPAWFLGLIILFGVHPPLEWVPIISLLTPMIAGMLFAIINDFAIMKIVGPPEKNVNQ